MKMALPRKGFSGADKNDDTTAWKNSIAESVKGWLREPYFIKKVEYFCWVYHNSSNRNSQL